MLTPEENQELAAMFNDAGIVPLKTFLDFLVDRKIALSAMPDSTGLDINVYHIIDIVETSDVLH